MNPDELGFFEKRPGSGIWYLSPAHGSPAYAPRFCAHCGNPFMGRRGMKNGRPRGMYCSPECGRLAQRTPNASYRSLHYRIESARGKAGEHACADCGEPAMDWSQTHGTTGLEPEDYMPRCRKCHRAYDKSHQGEKNQQAKLTEARVRGILASVGATHKELAALHGVTRQHITDIRNGRAWKHLRAARPGDPGYNELVPAMVACD